MNFVETTIDYALRCLMMHGLSTHIYDRRIGKLVYSSRASFYSAALKASQVLLFPAAFRFGQDRQHEDSKKLYSFSKLFFVVVAVNFVAIFVGIGTQWTNRAKAPQLFNEVLDMWRTEMAHLESSAELRRAAGRLSLLMSTITIVIVITSSIESFLSMKISASTLACSFYTLMLINIIVAVQFQFCQGMILGAYLFRILDLNLTRVVADVNGLCETHASRHAHRLSKELLAIGRLHAKLQKWVVSFKNLYQVVFLCILTSFFMTQVCILYILLRSRAVLWKASFNIPDTLFLLAFANIILTTLNMLLIFYTCGGLISACNAAGATLRDLSARRLASKHLERAIEMVCLELTREKIRLSICGLADLDGNTGFAMTEAAVMYIILLVQMHYEQF